MFGCCRSSFFFVAINTPRHRASAFHLLILSYPDVQPLTL